jgi:hypothetical protein
MSKTADATFNIPEWLRKLTFNFIGLSGMPCFLPLLSLWNANVFKSKVGTLNYRLSRIARKEQVRVMATQHKKQGQLNLYKFNVKTTEFQKLVVARNKVCFKE